LFEPWPAAQPCRACSRNLTAAATNLAELPLKASVLAKPNVVFGRDDSGSMDWEVLMSTDDGIAWWNSSNSAWDSTANKPVYTSAAATNRLTYLFPMGTTTGGQIDAIGSCWAMSGAWIWKKLAWGNLTLTSSRCCSTRQATASLSHQHPKCSP
jgi:hypothetical protein